MPDQVTIDMNQVSQGTDHSNGAPQRRWGFRFSERAAYFIFTFVLTIASLWFAAVTEDFAFGWREIIVGSLAGLILGCVVAIASEWLRELVFGLFFP